MKFLEVIKKNHEHMKIRNKFYSAERTLFNLMERDNRYLISSRGWNLEMSICYVTFHGNKRTLRYDGITIAIDGVLEDWVSDDALVIVTKELEVTIAQHLEDVERSHKEKNELIVGRKD